jgi:ribosome-associated protein
MREEAAVKKRRSDHPRPEQQIAVLGEHITLGQLLKVAGVVGTGGSAKHYLAETILQVNGEPEQRRGRKLYPGDLILAPGEAPIRLIEETTDETV